MELAGNATRLVYLTEERKEGRNAFLEKRKPVFPTASHLTLVPVVTCTENERLGYIRQEHERGDRGHPPSPYPGVRPVTEPAHLLVERGWVRLRGSGAMDCNIALLYG